MSRFIELLASRKALGFHLSVGFDIDPSRIPECVTTRFQPADDSLLSEVRSKNEAIVTFATEIAQAVGDAVCAFKPNVAFIEDLVLGQETLSQIVRNVRVSCPGVPVIVDRKVADIGSSNAGPARRYVGNGPNGLCAEALTVSPYMGFKGSLDSFIAEHPDSTFFVLCRTSNPGARDLQCLPVINDAATDPEAMGGLLRMAEGYAELIDWRQTRAVVVPQFLYVAYLASRHWNRHRNVGLVVGATDPDDLRMVCRIVRDTGVPLLIPGSSTQGGRIEDIVPILKREGCMDQAVIHLTRSVLYASSGDDFARAARAEVNRVNAQIADLLG